MFSSIQSKCQKVESYSYFANRASKNQATYIWKKFWNSIPNWLPLYITYTYMLIFPTCPWLKTRRKKFQCKIMSVVFPNEYITGSRIWTLVAFYMACAPPLSISLQESWGQNLFEVAFAISFLEPFFDQTFYSPETIVQP